MIKHFALWLRYWDLKHIERSIFCKSIWVYLVASSWFLRENSGQPATVVSCSTWWPTGSGVCLTEYTLQWQFWANDDQTVDGLGYPIFKAVWGNYPGWWFQSLWKIWKSVGMIIPNIWKNEKCSKPPNVRRKKQSPVRSARVCRNTQGLPRSVFVVGFLVWMNFPVEMSNVTVLAGTLWLFNIAMENHNF